MPCILVTVLTKNDIDTKGCKMSAYCLACCNKSLIVTPLQFPKQSQISDHHRTIPTNRQQLYSTFANIFPPSVTVSTDFPR